MGDCQNYGPFLGPYDNTGPNTGPNLGDPKRDHNFDNPPDYGSYAGHEPVRPVGRSSAFASRGASRFTATWAAVKELQLGNCIEGTRLFATYPSKPP